jgi:tetratricopeptide (TPR) repeat protein
MSQPIRRPTKDPDRTPPPPLPPIPNTGPIRLSGTQTPAPPAPPTAAPAAASGTPAPPAQPTAAATPRPTKPSQPPPPLAAPPPASPALARGTSSTTQPLPFENTGQFTVRGEISPLIGRDTELETLRGALLRAVEYQAPQVVTVLGNQGTGKSRLVSDWTGSIIAPVRVFRGRAIKDGPRYGAISRLLRHRFDISEGDESDLARDKFHHIIQDVFGDRRVGEVVHFLGSFLDLRFPESPFLRAFEDNQRQHDEIARAIFRRFVEVDASQSPVVLWFDDLHWADDDTLTVIEEASEGLAGTPVVIVVCARPELLVRRPKWCHHAGDHTRVELRNLEPFDSARLLRHLMSRADEVPDELIEDAVEQTGGNPFFMEELIRLFLANGTIDTSGAKWRIDGDKAAETELPISIEEAIEARIAALDPDERDLLEKGAIFGNVFWLSALVALTRCERLFESESRGGGKNVEPQPAGWSDDGLRSLLEKRLDGLVERDYLLRLPPEDSTVENDVEVVFKHNLERELCTKMIDADRRRRYHRIAAQWLDTKLTERSEEQLEFLAQLYERGGDTRRAAQCYIAGGDKARARYANEQAVDFYQRGLGLLDYDDALARIEALHNLGDVLTLIGRLDEAAVRFQEMLRTAWLLDHPKKGGAAHGRLGRLARQRGEYDRALEHFRMADVLFEKTHDRRGVAGALDDIGKVHWLRGAYPTALEHHRQALAIRRALGDKRSIALSLANIGRVHHDSGSFKAAIEQFREALELRREIDDKAGVISSLCDVGSVHEADGNLEAAYEFFAEAMRMAREIGDKWGKAHVLGRLGEVELLRKHSREAQGYLVEAIDIARSLGDRLGQAESSRRLAEVQLVLGDSSTALESARRALELFEKVGSRVHVGMAQRTLGEVLGSGHFPATDVAKAEHHFRNAIEILAAHRSELELARCYRAFATYRERAGQAADAAKLRAKADDIFGRLRGAANASS